MGMKVMNYENFSLFGVDKSALSNMVGYVLLISITIGLSVLVYGWLSFYVSVNDMEECSEGIDINIKSYECYPTNEFGTGRLKVVLKNNGLFSVDGYTLRVHDRPGSDFGFYVLDEDGTAMAPGDEHEQIYEFSDYDFDGHNLSTVTLVEVQPFLVEDGIRCKSHSLQDVLCYWQGGSSGDGSGEVVDSDNDNYDSLSDCDDGNADIYPGAVEICGNFIDEDCDGSDLECGSKVALFTFYDDFSDGDFEADPALSVGIQDGLSWDNINGSSDFEVDSSVGVLDGNYVEAPNTNDIQYLISREGQDWRDYLIEFDIFNFGFNSPERGGLMFAVQDENNYYYLGFSETSSELRKVENGIDTFILSNSLLIFPSDSEKSFELFVNYFDSTFYGFTSESINITVIFDDGDFNWQATNPFSKSGEFGIRRSSVGADVNDKLRYDNFSVMVYE